MRGSERGHEGSVEMEGGRDVGATGKRGNWEPVRGEGGRGGGRLPGMDQVDVNPREKLLEWGLCACGSRPGSLLSAPAWCFLRSILVFLRRHFSSVLESWLSYLCGMDFSFSPRGLGVYREKGPPFPVVTIRPLGCRGAQVCVQTHR